MSTTLSLPNPALVTQESARAMPRWVLLSLCVVYAVAGFLGRDPWRTEDLLSFGYMRHLAEQLGQSPSVWHSFAASAAQILGEPMRAQDSSFTHWLGALSIHFTADFLRADLAARLPFIAMLWGSMCALWYGVYALARMPQAQPVALAFGGQAHPTDYARALADGALLALLAALGMAQIGHEAAPALGQFLAISLAFSVAAHWRKALRWRSIWWPLALLAVLLLIWNFAPLLRHGVLAANTKVAWQTWAKQLLWFAWPTWLLAGWALLRWRRHMRRPWQHAPHLLLPLLFVCIPLLLWHLGSKSDRALFLALPGLSALAAFALPTLRRSVIALMDWFSLIFFSLCATVIGVVWLSLSTGWPSKPAQNVYRLLPSYEHSFSWLELVCGCLIVSAWVYLVHWRTKKHRPALWKSLVLPAAGATMSWALLMSLWLPILNHARSDAPITRTITTLLNDQHACLSVGEGVPPSLVAALLWHGGLTLERAGAGPSSCAWMITPIARVRNEAQLREQGWVFHSRVARPSQKGETLALWQRNKDFN